MNSIGTLRVLDQTGPASRQAGIGQGERLKALVVRRTAPGLFFLKTSRGGFHVRSEVSLPVGTTVRLRAEWRGTTLALVPEQPVITRGFGGGNHSSVPEIQAAITALLRSSMPVDPDVVASISSQLKQYQRTDRFLGRLLAMLSDKGIPLSQRTIDELILVLEPDRAGDRADSDSADTDAGRSSSSFGEPDGEPPDGERDDGSRDESEDVSAEFAKTLAGQTYANTPEANALKLFNHLRSRHDMWQIVPYRVSRDNWSASGTIRIRRDRTDGIQSIVIEVRQPDEASTFFRLEKRGGEYTIAVPAEVARDTGAAGRELFEKLRNRGILLDDTRDDDGFDGFSCETTRPGDSIDAFA